LGILFIREVFSVQRILSGVEDEIVKKSWAGLARNVSVLQKITPSLTNDKNAHNHTKTAARICGPAPRFIVITCSLVSFVQLRYDFPWADRVDHKTVFNIGGNKYRLIAAIHYNRRRVYMRAILTHAEYDKGKWKQD